uniref:Uncharacterized protein n=1 Tax=Hemiselmis tepida TaxID=464990 RepID=A0A7S0VZP0_9CRYP|mmetsp:Transcript_30443/g.77105  ORF Transcript_30443/g.77105 Transcript_30443/m.77105 type:complete len:159 (+) Transcript_30443:224-700(+)|eukprot:CAMPEP_0174929692 /NCGR_PEP_ID=MMETSP1355-20121228/28320_1 /TAXON_ID=464990 /ORGANISM="Hemiselmis tepida, Strain CCMP443" /LENGTH=158 /DNA_ID=CAMNT_0016175919 /DNA_START=210 /DNA_END=686 /DNA_ORIENTATION=-
MSSSPLSRPQALKGSFTGSSRSGNASPLDREISRLTLETESITSPARSNRGCPAPRSQSFEPPSSRSSESSGTSTPERSVSRVRGSYRECVRAVDDEMEESSRARDQAVKRHAAPVPHPGNGSRAGPRVASRGTVDERVKYEPSRLSYQERVEWKAEI